MNIVAGENPCVYGPRQSSDVARDRCLLPRDKAKAMMLVERPKDKVEVIAWQIIQKEVHLYVAVVICGFLDIGSNHIHHLGDDKQRVWPR